ncbi:MAG: hypothetical protein MZV70_18415 [Desulfobacterales bacterium]|nr:hypothetical protein [Desulfobacterales bacterium]
MSHWPMSPEKTIVRVVAVAADGRARSWPSRGCGRRPGNGPRGRGSAGRARRRPTSSTRGMVAWTSSVV